MLAAPVRRLNEHRLHNVINQPELTRGLDRLQLELTQRCNLQCAHCYSNSSPKTGDRDFLTLRDYKAVMISARALGATRLQFLGGEPTLSTHLAKLSAYAHSIEYQDIEIVSNLIATMPGELLGIAASLGLRFSTNFYSSNPAEEDKFTGRKGSLKRKRANLCELLKRGIEVRVGIIAGDQDEVDLETTEADLRSMGVQHFTRDRIRAFGRARKPGDTAEFGELCGNCWKKSIAVSYDGSVFMCPLARDWPVGNILTVELEEIARGEALSRLRQRVRDEFSRRNLQGGCKPSGNGSCKPDSTNGCKPTGKGSGKPDRTSSGCKPSGNDSCKPDSTSGCKPDDGVACKPGH